MKIILTFFEVTLVYETSFFNYYYFDHKKVNNFFIFPNRFT